MANRKFYVVWDGRIPGVYDNWDDAREQIEGYPGARYKGFSSAQEAARAYRDEAAYREQKEIGHLLASAGAHKGKTTAKTKKSVPDWRTNPEIDHNGWAVDASCMGNPGVMEYRGVDLATGEEIFRFGPVKRGTNNIGEFLAIVHAFALAAQRGEAHTIYSDSNLAMSWVRRKVMKTQLQPSPENEHLFEVIARALAWIRTHSTPCRLVKWETSRWGEIPADFGRK